MSPVFFLPLKTERNPIEIYVTGMNPTIGEVLLVSQVSLHVLVYQHIYCNALRFLITGGPRYPRVCYLRF